MTSNGCARARYLLFLAVLSLGAALAATVRPASGDKPFRQTGLASYYGPGLQGERTASGERFDQNELVAAHPTLPFGTVVRVTNLENGRQVQVRITDRGPYGKNRRRGTIIDVSTAAARKLRFIRDGLVRVRVEVVGKAPLEVAAAPAGRDRS